MKQSLPRGSADRNEDKPGRTHISLVAPSRERGSKPVRRRGALGCGRRSLAGARIETSLRQLRRSCHAVAPSRERGSKPPRPAARARRQLSLPRGSADRNVMTHADIIHALVAPSRERGSKHCGRSAGPEHPPSLPRGSADRNRALSANHPLSPVSLPRGSADRNHVIRAEREAFCLVAPSRERGSKPGEEGDGWGDGLSLPRGSADRNARVFRDQRKGTGRSLAGARIETCTRPKTRLRFWSLPRGSADRNEVPLPKDQGYCASLPRGSADRN